MMVRFPAKFVIIILMLALLPTVARSVVNIDDVAPDFTLFTPKGNSVKLSDFSDRVVVLFFMGYS